MEKQNIQTELKEIKNLFKKPAYKNKHLKIKSLRAKMFIIILIMGLCYILVFKGEYETLLKIVYIIISFLAYKSNKTKRF